MAPLAYYYQGFPPIPPGDVHPIVRIEWCAESCKWGLPDGGTGRLVVRAPEIRPSATTILITRLLADFHADKVILHGNALWHSGAKTLLFLLGDSGSGKTTLSGELLASELWHLVAEDTIILSPETGTIEPFPRAATLRHGGAAPATGLVPWQPVGQVEPSKQLFLAARYLQEVPPPGKVIVLVLDEAAEPAAASADGETAWVTHWEDGIAGAMERAGLPLARSEPSGSVHRIVYTRGLTGEERQLQENLLQAGGALLLHTERSGSRATPGPRSRPPEPVLESLGVAAGVRAVLHYVHLSSGRLTERSAGRVFFDLCRGLKGAKLHRFQPGGTPRQSAECLQSLALDPS